MATAAIAMLPLPLAGWLVLDLGAGTGAASRCIARAGGRPVALDAAHGMLLQARQDHSHLGSRPPACTVGEAERLPFRTGCFAAVVAAFSLSHVARPGLALAEACALLALAAAADLVEPRVDEVRIDTGMNTADELVRWRLGMAHLAPFVARLPRLQRARLVREAREAVGPAAQPWRPTVLMLSSRAPA